MNSRLCIVLCTSFLMLLACTKEEKIAEEEIIDLDSELMEALIAASPNGKFFHYILAEETELQHLPNQDPANRMTYEKMQLGKMLFFDPALAQNPVKESCFETYSCSTCHIPEAGFLPGRKQGIADGADGFGHLGSVRNLLSDYEESELDAQGIRPLSTLNVAYSTNTLWSGLFGSDHVNEGTEDAWVGALAEVNHLGFTGLESQNIEGVELHRMEVNDHVLDDFGYREMFDKAFPDIDVAERYTAKTISFALGAYLRTILTTRAPFQDWLKGNKEALTDQQKEGALLFFGKARCYKCHDSPALSSMHFHALGTQDLYQQGGRNTSADDPRNLGRGMFTGDPDDNYRFKVPQLYNLKDYRTYFHGSSKLTLEEVIDFKIKAQSENFRVKNDQLSPLFKPLELTTQEKIALIDFLENGLYDAEVTRYAPQEVLSGMCFPNSDEKSRDDLGCQ